MKKQIKTLLSEFIDLSIKQKNCYTCKHYKKTNNGYEYCKKINEEYPFDWNKFNKDSLSKSYQSNQYKKNYSLCKGNHFTPGSLKF